MVEVTRVAEQMVADRGSEARGRSLARLALDSPLASLVRSKSQVRRRAGGWGAREMGFEWDEMEVL